MEILALIANHEELSRTLRELLEKEASRLPESSEGFSDERLGQIARSRIETISTIERVFKEIGKYRTVKVSPRTVNPAR